MSDTENWVQLRAGCTPKGFLRRLRESICKDVIEANKHFEPDSSFSLSCSDALDLHVYRRLKGKDGDDAFVLFKMTNDSEIAVSHHYRNGNDRRPFSEKPMGHITLEWNHHSHSCTIKLCDENLSLVDLRQKTLGNLFFGD